MCSTFLAVRICLMEIGDSKGGKCNMEFYIPRSQVEGQDPQYNA